MKTLFLAIRMLLILIIAVTGGFAGLIIYLTATEYRPKRLNPRRAGGAQAALWKQAFR